MRKIERQMLQAIVNSKGWSKDNTRVEYNGDLTDCDQVFFSVYLHGHKIAVYYPKDSTLYVNNCGYATNTTKSRLNALIEFVADPTKNGIRQHKWLWIFKKNGIESFFPSNEWVAV